MIPITCYAPETHPDPCSFYEQCVEATQPCEGGRRRDVYAVSYGFKYCSRFTGLAASGTVSGQGREWITSTRSCLQEALVPFLPGGTEVGATCSELRAAAFQSHPFCYVSASPSFCRLPVSDYGPILKLYELPDMVTPESIAQMISVVDGCLRNWAGRDKLAKDDSRRAEVLRAWRNRSSGKPQKK